MALNFSLRRDSRWANAEAAFNEKARILEIEREGMRLMARDLLHYKTEAAVQGRLVHSLLSRIQLTLSERRELFASLEAEVRAQLRGEA